MYNPKKNDSSWASTASGRFGDVRTDHQMRKPSIALYVEPTTMIHSSGRTVLGSVSRVRASR